MNYLLTLKEHSLGTGSQERGSLVAGGRAKDERNGRDKTARNSGTTDLSATVEVPGDLFPMKVQ